MQKKRKKKKNRFFLIIILGRSLSSRLSAGVAVQPRLQIKSNLSCSWRKGSGDAADILWAERPTRGLTGDTFRGPHGGAVGWTRRLVIGGRFPGDGCLAWNQPCASTTVDPIWRRTDLLNSPSCVATTITSFYPDIRESCPHAPRIKPQALKLQAKLVMSLTWHAHFSVTARGWGGCHTIFLLRNKRATVWQEKCYGNVSILQYFTMYYICYDI